MKRNFNKIISLLAFILIFFNCATYKKQFYVGVGDIEQARMNVIVDFINTYKTPKRYLQRRQGKPFNVFHFVREKTLDDNTYLLSILPNNESIAMRIEDKVGEIPRDYFPNNYIVKKDKLFLWNDGVTPLQNGVLEVLNKFGVLDSTDIKMDLALLPDDFEDTRMITIDDRLESFNYFICRNDISEFKKLVTYKSFGYYKLPKLNCP